MIIFENDGEIDIQAIKTMGASIKEDGAIGYFGTGLKFAIAVLMRNNQSLVIYSGLNVFVFTKARIEIRGKEFDLVMLNGESMGFTSELGKNWQMWMAFREFYCNCLDEHGQIYNSDVFPSAQEGKTIIIIKGELFESEYARRSDNFLETKPIFETDELDIHTGRSHFSFYKGVRVYDLPKPGQYVYNYKSNLELTEDRTVKNPFYIHYAIGKAIRMLTDEEVIYKIITAPLGRLEADIDLNNSSQYSEEFERVAVREYKRNPKNINKTLYKFVRSLNVNNLYESMTLSAVEVKQLAKAIEFCDFLGYSCSEYKIICTLTMGPSVMAMVIRERNEIIISKQCFEKGTKYLTSTLIEEIIHLRESLDDETRSMQTYLFDKIISLGETMRGEPI